MNITEIELTIKNLVKGFEDNDEKGVVAWDGKLDVRPPISALRR